MMKKMPQLIQTSSRHLFLFDFFALYLCLYKLLDFIVLIRFDFFDLYLLPIQTSSRLYCSHPFDFFDLYLQLIQTSILYCSHPFDFFDLYLLPIQTSSRLYCSHLSDFSVVYLLPWNRRQLFIIVLSIYSCCLYLPRL